MAQLYHDLVLLILQYQIEANGQHGNVGLLTLSHKITDSLYHCFYKYIDIHTSSRIRKLTRFLYNNKTADKIPLIRTLSMYFSNATPELLRGDDIGHMFALMDACSNTLTALHIETGDHNIATFSRTMVLSTSFRVAKELYVPFEIALETTSEEVDKLVSLNFRDESYDGSWDSITHLSVYFQIPGSSVASQNNISFLHLPSLQFLHVHYTTTYLWQFFNEDIDIRTWVLPASFTLLILEWRDGMFFPYTAEDSRAVDPRVIFLYRGDRQSLTEVFGIDGEDEMIDDICSNTLFANPSLPAELDSLWSEAKRVAEARRERYREKGIVVREPTGPLVVPGSWDRGPTRST